MKSRIFIHGGLLLIAAALCLISYNLWDGHRAETAVTVALEQVLTEESAIEELPANLEPPAEAKIPGYLLNPDMDMPTTEADGTEYIGVLEIPDLALSLPVISEWSYSGLKLAPCRFEGSAYLNNLIIAAHNYRSHFGSLKNLRSGDEVIFTDAEDNVFRYAVSKLEIVDGNDLDTLESGEWDLTLFTCTLARTTRLVVRCACNPI